MRDKEWYGLTVIPEMNLGRDVVDMMDISLQVILGFYLYSWPSGQLCGRSGRNVVIGLDLI